MAAIKPINLESDTFAQMKQDMTKYINLHSAASAAAGD